MAMSAEWRAMSVVRFVTGLGMAMLLTGPLAEADGDERPEIDFRVLDDRVVVKADDKPIATYVFKDQNISRPYFAHVHAPSGQQVTRNHPPRKGDAQDHATFHPGIWMAFGDISGHDYWRLKAKVVHVAFDDLARTHDQGGTFAVKNRYLTTDGKGTVCEEICRFDFLVRPSGYLITWDSKFSSGDNFYFGDQEEMGLGVRVATPLAVKTGGRIVNSENQINEKGVWGKQAKWCDYSGDIDGLRIGMTLMPHPTNFRQSWFHARDYGFVAANAFGVKAFTRGEASKIHVAANETLRLRYGVLLHSSGGRKIDLNAAYSDYVRLTK